MRGQLAARGKEAAAERAGIARLPRQVVDLHVLDEVALVADGLVAEIALVAAARQLAAVAADKEICLPKF